MQDFIRLLTVFMGNLLILKGYSMAGVIFVFFVFFYGAWGSFSVAKTGRVEGKMNAAKYRAP